MLHRNLIPWSMVFHSFTVVPSVCGKHWYHLLAFQQISGKQGNFIFKLENPTASITERLRIQLFPLLETIS